MFSLKVAVQNHMDRVVKAADRASFRNLGHAIASIRKEAIESIIEAEGPSRPGSPPHTHTGGMTKKGKKRKGQLQRAITFHNDRKAKEAIAGPRASVVGVSGAAHEFGGDFKGEDYPERPFMGPALEKNLDRFAAEWQGSIGQ